LKSDTDLMKSHFAAQLKQCLESKYRGRLPSISTIARDFSLQASHLQHVSGETVRNWLRAKSIPQYPRAQSLADWLGPELLMPFNNWSISHGESEKIRKKKTQILPSNATAFSPEEVMRLVLMIQKLSSNDFDMINKLAQRLVVEFSTEKTPQS
jgi:hypothetical protein